MDTDYSWYQSLPRKRMAAGMMLFNNKEQLLIVQPKYRSDGWLLPGGVVEKTESPRKTAIRETHEELGLTH